MSSAIIEDAVRFLRSLPTASADVLCTDPPYSSGGFNESQRRGGSSSSMTMPWLQGDAMGTLAMSHLLREVALEARRVVKPGGHALVFSDWKMVPVFGPVIESASWRWRSQIVWDKLSHGKGNGFMPTHEMILHFSDPSATFVANVPNVVHCKRVPHAERDHPTQKPTDLLVAILRPVLAPGGVVVDPFAGAGTIVEAAGRMGAVAWCCDADPSHLPAMARRVARESLQGGLEL